MRAASVNAGEAPAEGVAEGGPSVTLAVGVGISAIWIKYAISQRIFERPASLGSDARAGPDIRGIGIPKDAVVEGVSKIICPNY